VLILAGACVFQATTAGCSSGKATESTASEDSQKEGEVPFFESAGNQAASESGESGWTPVSDSILEEIAEMYGDSGLVIQTLEKDTSGSLPSMHCSLSQRDGISDTKQLLDGLYLLYLTFPNMRRYLVDVDGRSDRRVDANWNDLEELYDGGYSFETLPEDAVPFWGKLFGDNSAGSDDDDGTLNVKTGDS
jgi:hypothetical protein